jgi:hypothetical protein
MFRSTLRENDGALTEPSGGNEFHRAFDYTARALSVTSCSTGGGAWSWAGGSVK